MDLKNDRKKNKIFITESDFVKAEEFNDYNVPVPENAKKKKRKGTHPNEILQKPYDAQNAMMQQRQRNMQRIRQKQQAEEERRRQREQERIESLRMIRNESQPQPEEKVGRITVTGVSAYEIETDEQELEQDGYVNQEYDDEPSFKYLNLKDGKISEADRSADELADDEDDEPQSDGQRSISQQITPETATVTDIRQERKRQRSKRLVKTLVAFGIVAALGLTAFVTSKYWIPKLEGILDKPHDTIVNDGKAQGGNFPLKVDQSNILSISQCNDMMITLDVNRVVFYKNNGEQLNAIAHNYSSPVIDVNQKKLVAYDNAGKSFQVMNKKGVIYTKNTESPILMAKLGPNGYVGVVTQTEKYSAYVTFYDETGSEIYNWASGMRVTDICFNQDGKGCCISAIASSAGKIDSTIYSIDFNRDKPIMMATVNDGIALEARKMENGDYWVVCDNKFVKFDKSGKQRYCYDLVNELISFDLTDRYAALYMGSVTGTHATLMMYDCEDQSDDVGTQIDVKGKPQKLQIKDSDIIAFNDKTVDCYDVKGNLLSTVSVSQNYVDCVYANKAVYLLGYRNINKLNFDT